MDPHGFPGVYRSVSSHAGLHVPCAAAATIHAAQGASMPVLCFVAQLAGQGACLMLFRPGGSAEALLYMFCSLHACYGFPAPKPMAASGDWFFTSL